MAVALQQVGGAQTTLPRKGAGLMIPAAWLQSRQRESASADTVFVFMYGVASPHERTCTKDKHLDVTLRCVVMFGRLFAVVTVLRRFLPVRAAQGVAREEARSAWSSQRGPVTILYCFKYGKVSMRSLTSSTRTYVATL